jgi:transposase
MSSVSDIDEQSVMIDATIVRAHACASGYSREGNETQALGRSKGGFTTKIHALVDGLGNPIKFIVTGGHRNDITQAEELLKEQHNTVVLADKGYDSMALVDFLESQDCCAVIPSKKNAKCPRNIDNELYKERFLIEAFFSKLKHFRRVFSRFDKTISAFSGFLHLAGALIWMR